MLDRIDVLKLAMAWAAVHPRPMTTIAQSRELTDFAMTVLEAAETKADGDKREQAAAINLNTSRGRMKL